MMMFPSLWAPQGQTRQLVASAIRLMSEGRTDRHKQPAAVPVTRASCPFHVFARMEMRSISSIDLGPGLPHTRSSNQSLVNEEANIEGRVGKGD